MRCFLVVNIFKLFLGCLKKTLEPGVLLFLLLQNSPFLREVLLKVHISVDKECVHFIQNIGLNKISNSFRSIRNIFWGKNIVLHNNLVVDTQNILDRVLTLVLDIRVLLKLLLVPLLDLI